MQQINLFKLRKTLSIIVGVIGGIISLLEILGWYTDYGIRSEFSFIGVLLFLQMIFQYRNFNKFYLHFDKHQLKWYFPGMNEAKQVNLQSTTYEISKDWKGVILSNANENISISTDGLWDRDKNIIYQKLKEYYS